MQKTFTKVSEIPNLDQDRLEQLSGVEVVITEKIDGTNVRVGCSENSLWCGGHNHIYEIGQKTQFDAFGWGLFVKERALDTLVKEAACEYGADFALYGEFCGPKIQGNPYKLSEHDVFIFDIRVGGKWLSWPEMTAICDRFDLKHVPVDQIGGTTNQTKLETLFKAPSLLCPDLDEREGIVIKAFDEARRFSDHTRMIVKYRRKEERKYKPKRSPSAKQLHASQLADRVDEYLTAGRVEKAVSHLREENSELSFKTVMEELCRDILKECDADDRTLFLVDQGAFSKTVSKCFGSTPEFRAIVVQALKN